MFNKRLCTALLITLSLISVPAFAEDDDGDCSTNSAYEQKRIECDELGSEFMFRHVYTDGCDCVKVETAMIDEVATGEGDGGGEALSGEE